MAPRLVLIAALAEGGVIGRDGGLPWRLPDDLRHFKALTLGKPLLMGRRTAESLGRALPGRRNIVITSSGAVPFEGMEAAASLAEALHRCVGEPEACVIGGAALYGAALPMADVLELTHVRGAIEGDTHFPAIDWSRWREATRRSQPADERHAWPLDFVRYERRLPPA